jgi:hypothetical protein
MAMQEADILAALNTNYKTIIDMLPPDLAKEFQNKVMRPSDLKEYATKIMIAMQFKDEAACIRIENWLAGRFEIGNFNKKAAQKGLNPVSLYEQLLKGFFDYR